MKYIYTDTPVEKAAEFTANRLIEHLKQGEKVLLLLSGGSGAAIAIAANKLLADTDLSNLVVSMTDERYGDIGHPDENWQQLLDAGLNLPGATLRRPLIGTDIQLTTDAFNSWLIGQFKSIDYSFAIFGVGSDGHTAGIKPGSPAVVSTQLAAHLKSEDFDRITITFPTIRKIDEAVIQASGVDKRAVISDLIYKDIPMDIQPAQILKSIPKSVLYTNNKREDL